MPLVNLQTSLPSSLHGISKSNQTLITVYNIQYTTNFITSKQQPSTMKFLAVVLALATAALAAPNSPPPPPPPPPTCKPATYACAKNPKTGVDGWQVCDVTSKWVVSKHGPSHLHTLQSIKHKILTSSFHHNSTQATARPTHPACSSPSTGALTASPSNFSPSTECNQCHSCSLLMAGYDGVKSRVGVLI